MNDPLERDPLDGRIKALQIIIAGLIFGMATISAVLAILTFATDATPNLDVGFPLWVLPIVLLVTTLSAWSIIGPSIRQSQMQSIANRTWTPPKNSPTAFPDDRSKLMSVVQTMTILRAATLEGQGMLAAILAFIEGKPFGFGVVAVVVLMLVSEFPTRAAVNHQLSDLEQQLERLRAEADGSRLE